MKKVYTKPVLVMENFSLSQSICHNCSDSLDFTQATMKYKSTCGWNIGVDLNSDGANDILFAADPQCNSIVGEDDSVGVCYNNPDGGINLFNS